MRDCKKWCNVIQKSTTPSPFFAKLILANGDIVELEGSGELTRAMVSQLYSNTLKSAEIGELCTSIESYAFSNCTCLTSISIPNSVTSIGNEIFYNCTDLTSIVIESGNTVYDSRDDSNGIIKTATNELIAGCQNTVIPNSVTSIGDYAFHNCSGLISVTIPNFVTNISDGAFLDCTGLTSVSIGNSTTSIGSFAFSNCVSLTNIISLTTTAPTIGDNTFRNIKTSGILTVLSGSSGYDTWMQNGSYYLGMYNWTKVEQ